MNVFDIIGPIMVGPSSSHTAGANRIGRYAREILNEEPKNVTIQLSGSFKDTYTSDEVKYYEKSTNNIILFDNLLLNKYFNKIKNSCTKFYMTKEENITYRYRPEALSTNKYGTLNLWYIILKVNGCEDFSEFHDFDYVLLPNLSTINECLVNEEYIIRKNSK